MNHQMVVRRLVVVFAVVFLLVQLEGCGKGGKQGAARPPAEVTVITVSPKDTPVTLEFVGQTESSRQVEIRARVNGFLEKRLYEEGSIVQAGQAMFQMERTQFEASLQETKGDLAIQQARYSQAKADLDRIRPLVDLKAISKKDFDDAISAEEVARAAVVASQGRLRQAELNLGYTTVKSPVTGLSSGAKKQDGSYISVGPEGLLTYVAQIDPVWVNYSISENEALKYRDEESKGLIKLPPEKEYTVEVVLADGTIFPQKGKVSFREPSFSSETGTYRVRAVFSNPKGELRPGQFVRVHLKGALRPKAVLVPQRAVMQGAKGNFVWIVSAEGKAQLRNVEAGDWYGNEWFISNGLKAGEKVIVDGAKVADGMPVKPVELDNDGQDTSGGAVSSAPGTVRKTK